MNCPGCGRVMMRVGGTPKTKQYECHVCDIHKTKWLGEVGDYGFGDHK